MSTTNNNNQQQQQDASSNRGSSLTSHDRSPRESRRMTSQQQISQIERSVTHLLVATKQLLETLTLWSRNTASEKDVSDIYVRLGYEFNIACRAFAVIGVETKDLGPVPDLLRTILEETLSNDASQANLDRYLPRIRDIIVGLLQGLKKKQQKLRQRPPRESGSSTASEPRQDSGSYETITSRQSTRGSTATRQDSHSLPSTNGGGASLPPRASSTLAERTSPTRYDGVTNHATHRASSLNHREKSESTYTTPDVIPSTTLSEYPLPMPPTAPDTNPAKPPTVSSPPLPPLPPTAEIDPSHLQPNQQDAFTKLQRGGDLERRASRRFSAYQISKHLGSASSGIPMVPSTQNTPLPNRSREARESMNAVKVRGANLPGRSTPKITGTEDDSSSIQKTPKSQRPADGSTTSLETGTYDTSNNEASISNLPTTTKQSSDKNQTTAQASSLPSYKDKDQESNLSGVVSKDIDVDQINVPVRKSSRKHAAYGDVQVQDQNDGTVEPKELTLFLQYKSKIKKFILAGGYQDLSIPRLQLAFIEKFAWSTHSNGADLPEIYIQDPVSGVRHELEDLSDVKNHSVLALNVDVLDEVKKHMDDGMGTLTRIVEGVRSVVDDQSSTLQRVSTRQADFAKEIARLSSPKLPNRMSGSSSSSDRVSLKGKNDQLGEVQKLRRDLAIMRQTYTTLVTEVESTMANIHAKASMIKSSPVDGLNETSYEGSSGRIYVNAGKKSLSADSERIISRVDDLQDVVEELRKDVVTRGVRPLPRQLETVRKEIFMATGELKKMQDFIKKEKPRWTDIWKNELQIVCEDQNLLTVQEELAADLEDDLAKATDTFTLVEEATKAQNVPTNVPGSSRSTSRTLPVSAPDMDPLQAKNGVLGEVRALQPNHESRLEAIERAERARERDLANRGEGAFKKELGSFVEQGRLKKSGGVEETERRRRMKDERARKEVWDRMNARAAGIEPEQKVPSLPPDADATEIPERLEIHASATNEKIMSPELNDFVEINEDAILNDHDQDSNNSPF